MKSDAGDDNEDRAKAFELANKLLTRDALSEREIRWISDHAAQFRANISALNTLIERAEAQQDGGFVATKVN